MRLLLKLLNLPHFFLLPFYLFLVSLPIQISICDGVNAQLELDRKSTADRLREKGDQLNAQKRYQEAIQLWEESLSIYRVIKDANSEFKIAVSVAHAYTLLEDYQKAIKYYNIALSLSSQTFSITDAKRVILYNLGDLYRQIGEYQKAIDYLNRALAISILNKAISIDHMDKGVILNSLGLAHMQLGKYQEAIELYQQCLLFSRVNSYSSIEMNVLGNLANVYRNLGEYQKTIVYIQQSLAITRKLGDLKREGVLLNNLGIVYDVLGKHQKATEYYQKALNIARQIKSRHDEGHALGNLGFAYTSLGRYDQAILYLQQSLEISKEIGNRSAEGASVGNLGVVYSSLLMHQKAIEYFQQSLAIYTQIGERDNEAESLYRIGNSFKDLKRPELATVFYKQAVNTYETIRKDIKGLSKEEKQSYLNTIAQTYRSLADLLLKQGRILEAQQVLELLKVEEIRAYTRNTRAVDDTNGIATNKTETKTIDKHSSLIALGLRVDECEQQKCPQLSQLIQQREVIATEYEQTAKALIKEIRDRKSDDDQFFDPRKVAKMNEIVSAQPNTVLIYPLILKDKIWVLWASKGGITKSIEVPNVGLEKVSSNVLKLRTLLQSPNNLDELQQTSKQLYDWLIPAELQAELNANKIEHLIFAPDSVTRYIPMGVLFDGKKYLIENYTIATIISADLTNTTARLPNSAKSTSILAAGLSQSISGFSPLPNVLTEINAIVRTADNPNNGIYDGIKLLDRSFTRENLRDNLGNHAIAHIATHGKFVSGDADKSFLVLGDGKTLPIPEIAKFRGLEKLHLVVLSACQTALGGTNGDGTEIAGISYYFLNTGAKAVIASLWEVSDDSTSLLMQQFYNNLAKSTTSAPITKAEAMQQAQLSLLQKQITAKDSIRRGTLAVVYQAGAKPTDNYSHPYYWSPFILIGNGW